MYYIYVIHNSINDKKYVGRTIDIHRRWLEHKSSRLHTKYLHHPMYIDMDTYGVDKYWCEVLETIDDKEEATQREKYWTNRFNSNIPNGYNDKTGDNHSDRIKNKLSQQKIGERNPMFGLKGAECCNSKRVVCVETGMVFDCMADAADWAGLNGVSHISNCCNEKGLTAGGYHWVYEGNELNPKLLRKWEPPNKKKVVCIETGYIYESIAEAKRITGIGNICSVLKGNRKTAGGYHWEYVDDK